MCFDPPLRPSIPAGDLRKFGRLLPMNDEKLAALEAGEEPSKPFFEKDEKRTVIWIEHLYRSLRRAIATALDTPAKSEAVTAYFS